MIKASIIIPSYNEQKDLGEAIRSLSEQSFKDFEVIVVDDGSTDQPPKIAKELGARVFRQSHKGPGAARNLGAKNAKGAVLVFVDSDMTFDKDYLKNLIGPIKKGIMGTTHEQEIVKNTTNIWGRCWGKIRVNKEEAQNVKIFRAIKKDKFLEMGGFNPKYGYADDQTFWFEYRIKPIVAKNTICYHKNPDTLNGVYKQSRWIGASIENPIVSGRGVKHLSPIVMFLLFPIGILFFTIKRLIRNKDPSIIIQMLIFMFVRYFGTLAGITRKNYLGINSR